MQEEMDMAYNMSAADLAESGIEAKNELNYEFVKSNIQDLEGKMLTLIEATIEDKTRQKAIKDMVRDMFGSKYDWLWEATYMLDIDESYEGQLKKIK